METHVKVLGFLQIILGAIGYRFGEPVSSVFVDLGNRITEISARCRARR